MKYKKSMKIVLILLATVSIYTDIIALKLECDIHGDCQGSCWCRGIMGGDGPEPCTFFCYQGSPYGFPLFAACDSGGCSEKRII